MRKPLDPAGQTPALTRRAALGLGIAGLGAAAAGLAVWPRRAGAFTVQDIDASTMAAFHNACGNVAYHDRLAGEVRSILASRHLPAAAMPQSVVCPICGCKVAV